MVASNFVVFSGFEDVLVTCTGAGLAEGAAVIGGVGSAVVWTLTVADLHLTTTFGAWDCHIIASV
jgi:hypothetical protein